MGGGIKWLYAQCLLGDSADNIPGIKGYGNVKAFSLLKDISKEKEMYEAVLEVYKKAYDEKADEYLQETASLLWIQREDWVMWRRP